MGKGERGKTLPLIARIVRIFIVFFSLIVVGALCLHNQSAFAIDGSSDPYIHVAPLVFVAYETGELFDIAVNVSNVANLHDVEFKLSYNASFLGVVQVAQGSFLPYPPDSSVDIEIDNSAGWVFVNISAADYELGRSGSGTLARITFNVTLGASCSYSVLHLQDSLLFDDSMTPILHSSIDGLYFWRTLQPDPPILGRYIDLHTQRGGIGPQRHGGFFLRGEVVQLYSSVTYNSAPVQNIIVAFQVIDPFNSTFVLSSITDQTGSANASFRIPKVAESRGEWKAVSTAKIAEETVWDTTIFWCEFFPTGGLSKPTNTLSLSRLQTHYAVLLTGVVLTFAAVKKRSRVKESIQRVRVTRKKLGLKTRNNRT